MLSNSAMASGTQVHQRSRARTSRRARRSDWERARGLPCGVPADAERVLVLAFAATLVAPAFFARVFVALVSFVFVRCDLEKHVTKHA